jgi:hypothetical protein
LSSCGRGSRAPWRDGASSADRSASSGCARTSRSGLGTVLAPRGT